MKFNTTLMFVGVILITIGTTIFIVSFLQFCGAVKCEHTTLSQLSSLLNGCRYLNQLEGVAVFYYNCVFNMYMGTEWIGIFIAIVGVVLVLIATVVYRIKR